MKITYYGHSCFNVEVNGTDLLFDPFIRPNKLADKIDVSKIKADYILVSHGHEDHIADVLEIANQNNANVITSFEVYLWLKKNGLTNGHPMNHGGSWDFDFGKVKFVNAVHSSSLPDGSYGGNPGGFVIESNKKSFYYSGDTALHYDMKLLGETKQLDFAFLCIGDNYTMGVDDALLASSFIKCNRIVGMHYNTFEHTKMDTNSAKNIFSNAGKELSFMEIGSTIEL